MASKEEILNKILDALKQKAGNRTHTCSICGQMNWVLGDRFVRLPADTRASGGVSLTLGGPTYPLAVLICANCGNTHFLNLLLLGFQNLDELTITEEASGGIP